MAATNHAHSCCRLLGEDFADFDPTVYDPSEYSNGWELLEQNGEGVSLSAESVSTAIDVLRG